MTQQQPSHAAPVGSPAITGRLRNLRQAAGYLGVSFWTVRDYVLAGLIPTVTLPALRAREGERPQSTLRRVLIDVEDLDRFIADHKGSAAVLESGAPSKGAANTGLIRRGVPAVCPREAVQKPESRA